jgi:hypothetical protein
MPMTANPIDRGLTPWGRCGYTSPQVGPNTLVNVTFIHVSPNGFTMAGVRAQQKDCDGKPRQVTAQQVLTCHRAVTPELGPGTYEYSKARAVAGEVGEIECNVLITGADGAPLLATTSVYGTDGVQTYPGDLSEAAVCGWLERVVELVM